MIRSGRLAPARNMAIDEALLVTPGPPTLRMYGWSPPGLSLGYFQPSAPFAGVPGQHVLVRRLTGGGAIYHDREITWALTGPQTMLPAHVPSSYELLHRAVRRALGSCGVAVRRGEGDVPAPRARPDQPWCLLTAGPCDLLAPSGGKLLGSAQRRIGRPVPRLLHHASLVLESPAATPRCGAVAESGSPDGERLTAALVAAIATALGRDAEPGAPTAEELQLAADLETTRYRSNAFTLRR